MNFASFHRFVLFTLIPVSLISTVCLYSYPAFRRCGFYYPEKNTYSESISSTSLVKSLFPTLNAKTVAPFRLLALGDPQIEGDSSIGYVEATNFPSLKRLWRNFQSNKKKSWLQTTRFCLHDLIDFSLDDIPKALQVWRKRLDHIGNDYYLGHIYRTLHWWTNPTHVAVLGDLIGSQWVDDDEYGRRGWRFWNRVFNGGLKVEKEVTAPLAEEFPYTRKLDEDADAWKRRVINVAGNHDIGYAGDISPARMERFSRIFGDANYELRFQISTKLQDLAESKEKPVPELRIIVLNDLNLDVPVSCKALQDETYTFLNSIISTSHDVSRSAHFTLVLTHIPLFKEAGICVDGPFFDYFVGEFANGLKEQHHLSQEVSRSFLEGIYGMSGSSDVAGQGFGRKGVILNGHDHEGCDTLHYIKQSAQTTPEWKAMRWDTALSSGILNQSGIPHLREVTVRSMMGAYDGNAGLLSVWFDEEAWDWEFDFSNCQLGKQHFWWVIHIVDLVTLIVAILYGGLVGLKGQNFLSRRMSRNQVSKPNSSPRNSDHCTKG